MALAAVALLTAFVFIARRNREEGMTPDQLRYLTTPQGTEIPSPVAGESQTTARWQFETSMPFAEYIRWVRGQLSDFELRSEAGAYVFTQTTAGDVRRLRITGVESQGKSVVTIEYLGYPY